MELLNLDAIVAIPRNVTIKGQDYAVAEQTVEQMLTNLKMVKDIQAAQGNTDEESEAILKSMREVGYQILPNCPKDVMNSLTMRQLSALTAFASKPEEEVKEAVEEAEEAEQSGKQ